MSLIQTYEIGCDNCGCGNHHPKTRYFRDMGWVFTRIKGKTKHFCGPTCAEIYKEAVRRGAYEK
ncbi:hypothetical protein R83H12_00411 [Fibrobacteria bacterium R8-3-H12]